MASRACALMLLFATLALAVVWIRAEQTRALARAVQLEGQRVSLRRDLWRAQANVARLRAPTRLYDSLDLFRANLATRVAQPADRTSRSPRGVSVD